MTDRPITLLTYNQPHRKTQDVALRLFLAGFTNVTVVAQEWIERKQMNMLYPQRPGDAGWPAPPIEAANPWPDQFRHRFRWNYKETEREELEETLDSLWGIDAIVIGGAGILPNGVAERWKVVNSHPGYLPFTRGLDTIKWAIYHDLPIGVTTHLIDERADAGRLIHQVRCPLKKTDDFTRFALRLYELEMDMIVPALMVALATCKTDFPEIDVEEFPTFRRMGRSKEREMIKRFETLRQANGQPGDAYMKFVLPPNPWPRLS